MATANLSVGINTKPAHEALKKLKDEMANIKAAIPVTIDPKSVSSALSGTKIKVTIDAADLASQFKRAAQDGLSGLKLGGGSIDTTQIKAGIDQIKQYMANAANDPAMGNALADNIKKGTPKAAAAAKEAGKAAGKAFADGEEEGARTAKISYRFKQGAGSVSISEKTNYTAEQVKARAEAEKADASAKASMLKRIDMMRTEFEAKKQLQALNEAGYRQQELAKQKAEARMQALNETGHRQMQYRQIQQAQSLQALNDAGYRQQELAKQAHQKRMELLDARFAASSAKSQLNKAKLAESLYARGIDASGVVGPLAASFGNAAGIAQLSAATKQLGEAHKEATGHTKTHAAAMRDAHSAARGLASGMGMMWLTWGNIAPLLAGASLSHGFIQAMKAGTEFAYQLTFVKALGGETAESVRGIGNAALELSKNGLFGPVELANGLRTLSQAGLSAAESMKALPVVLDLATVGEMNMKDAAVTLVGVMTAFNLDKSDLTKIGDVFAKAAAVSQTSVEQMTQAMKTASVVGEQYGATMQDTATALTLLAKMNITGTAAGTSLRNMLKELYSPTEKAAKIMKDLGVSAQTASGELKPFPDVIFSMKKKLEEFNKASQVKILQGLFGERGAKEAVAMLSLTREEWDKLNKTISESGGFMREVSAELEGTVKGSFKQAINTLQVSLIEAYNSTEGAAGQLAGKLKETFGSTQFKESLTTIVTGMLGITNALVTMAPALAVAAGGWIALRAAMIGAAVWTSVSTALAGATLATQTLGAVAAGTATTLTGSTGILAAARMLPGVLGAAGASLIATTGLLGPLAIAIGAAGTAWYLFRDRTVEAMQQSADAVAQGAASMRTNLANILRDVHNLPAAASRKAMDAQRQVLVDNQNKLLEQRESLKKTYGIKSDAEAKEFSNRATSVHPVTGEVYTETGAKYDAVNAYLQSQATQKDLLKEFSKLNQTIESVAESEKKPEVTVTPTNLKNWTGGGGGGGRADREAAKLENSVIQDLEKRYQAELKTVDAYYAKLEKIESTSAQYGIKTKEEAESKITALTEEHWTKRLEKVSTMSDEMSALLGKSVKLSEADAQKAKTFVATAQEEINTLKEKIEWIKEEARLRAEGAEVRFNKNLRDAADELDKEQAARRQKIYGGAEDPISRARSEGELAAELKYTKLRTEAEEELRIARLGGDKDAIESAQRRRDIVLETIAQQKVALADLFETDTRYMQSAEYGWNQFWTKYYENAVTAAKVVEQSMDSVTKHLENAISEVIETGRLDWKKLVSAIAADLGKIAAKGLLSDIAGFLSPSKKGAGGSAQGAGMGGGDGGIISGVTGALKSFWDSLTGATGATAASTASTLKDIVQLGVKTTTETSATAAVATLATSAAAASAALQALAASSAATSGASTAASVASAVAAAAANGAVFDRNLSYFATGGIVNSPTLFRFADGTGMMGEAGPEAIMPLARDSQGRLGVRYEGREAPQQSGRAISVQPAQNNLRIVNAFDTSVVGDYMGSREGEKVIMNVIRRNQNTISNMVYS